MKKILFVINELATGGVPSSLASLYSYIKDEYEIDVLPLSWVGNADYNFIESVVPEIPLLSAYSTEVCNFHGMRKIQASVIKIFKRCLNNNCCDFESFVYRKIVLHIERSKSYDAVISFQDRTTAVFCQHFTKFKKIAWIHCDYSRLIGELNDSRIFQKFDDIVCVSQFTANQFSKQFPLVKNKIHTIYNISDTDRITSLGREAIADLKFNHKKFNIISIGRLSEVKRFYEIPKIACKLKQAGVDFCWYIVGGGSELEYKKILSNISQYGVADFVIPLGGKENPYPFLKESDLFVSLSSTEACPMVFNEARIFNVPIVSTDFGSSFEFIEDGFNGVIRPLESLSDAIKQMIVDDSFYILIKGNTKKTIINNENILKQVATLLA